MNNGLILNSLKIVFFTGIFLAWSPSSAYEGIEPESAAATVVTGQFCSFNETIGGPALTFHPSKNVLNNNQVKLTCVFQDIFNDSGKPKHFNGFLCGINIPGEGFFITSDSRLVISTGDTDNFSSAVLQCWLKFSNT